jgi:selenide,water dikinase
LAGGHSIDSPEPVFGLAVSGLVQHEFLKKNNTAEEGDWLFLTKPLGVGVLSTAQKRGFLSSEHQPVMIESMVKLNRVGELLATLPEVTAMTDVTGFGLLGHLVEMTEGRGLSAELFYEKIPVLDGVRGYISQRIFPDATTRNWSSFGEKIGFGTGVNVLEAFTLLPDPQTNGGLLFTVKNVGLDAVKSLLEKAGLAEFTEPIGRMTQRVEKSITVLQR